MKSFVRKDGGDEKKVRDSKDDDPGNPTISFKGEKRRNDTHQSTTDAQSVLYRKAAGQEAKLCYGFHLLMENRHGLVAEMDVFNPVQQTEAQVALEQIKQRAADSGIKPRSVGADRVSSSGSASPHGADGRAWGRGIGCSYHAEQGLPAQSAHSQANRGGLRMDEDLRRVAQDTLQGQGSGWSLGILRGKRCNLVRMARLALGPPLLPSQ
jgi:hypothetical protein